MKLSSPKNNNKTKLPHLFIDPTTALQPTPRAPSSQPKETPTRPKLPVSFGKISTNTHKNKPQPYGNLYFLELFSNTAT